MDNKNEKLFIFEEIFLLAFFCFCLSCLQITKASHEMLKKKFFFLKGERKRESENIWFSIIFIHVEILSLGDQVFEIEFLVH